MTSLPEVVRAEHQGGFRIRPTFGDGRQKTVDFRVWLVGPVFEPLLDEVYFRRFFLEGGTVSWPNGADVAPETLYAAQGRRRGGLTAARRAVWRHAGCVLHGRRARLSAPATPGGRDGAGAQAGRSPSMATSNAR